MEFFRLKQRMRPSISSDGRLSVAYTLGYLVTSNSATELSVRDVYSGLGLRPGIPFSEDPNATLQDMEIDRRETTAPYCAWDVEITFATNAKVPESDSQDPTQQRVRMSKRFFEAPKNIIRNRNGSLIINAAGDPFTGGVAAADFPFSFVYEWNRYTPTRGFHKKINANTFNGCEPGTLVCLISCEKVYEGAWEYWRETIEMRNNPEGWNPSPLNAGLREIKYNIGDNTLAAIVDAYGQPVSEPQPLYDGSSLDGLKGTVVQPSDRPASCKYIDVDHFEQAAFEKIGVPEFPE